MGPRRRPSRRPAPRAVLEFRGEIVTVPAEKGDPRNLTGTPGAHERVAGLVARRQVDRLLLRRVRRVRARTSRPRTARATRRRSSSRGAGFYGAPAWSPDSAEDRLRRQLLDALLARPRDGRGRRRSPRSTLYRPGSQAARGRAGRPTRKWIAYTARHADLLPAASTSTRSTRTSPSRSPTA
ncbi:MAG: hypothetical protein M0C28_40375 [Candidatus Moduliflexus flocculans]|nr:hypothetical protein [Candidatus Moduliflexus flocculans]